ncbi:MAG: sensor histidine kinase [Candidatus Geothermincolia bacterium]
MKLLLVEDDSVDQMAFERFVRREGLPYDYVIADSVEAAREALTSDDFDVILLDYNLGDGTAFDVLDMNPEAPTIIITGANQIDLAVNAMKAGAYDYLVKDQDRDYLHVLPLAVDSAIRLREVEDTARILSHALMSAGDSIFITDLNGSVTLVNTAASETYGYPKSEVLGKDIGFIGEIGPDGEYYHRRSDGTVFPVSLSRSIVKDDKGSEVAVVVMVRDITERKQAEEELKRINRELEGYAHTVSHDLKGPLTSTVLAASTMEKLMSSSGILDTKPEFRDLLGVIDRNVWKSASLIDDLLSLAEAGQVPKDVQEVDINEVVGRIVEENALSIEELGMEIVVDDELGSVLGSPTHLYQLFANLISNCIKHCDSPEPVVMIERLDDSETGMHRYLVRDNGSGIPEKDLANVFAPFFKGSSGGTGIGLATVEKITKLYGGEVRAFNDGGACFEFSIADYAPGAAADAG